MEAPVVVGDVVAGKYTVERILACGGSGVVVLARHLTLLEPCAIKLMRPEALLAPMARERFLREARAAARIKSDHVVKVFDVGQLDDETPYMVMEYLEGTDLEEMVGQRGALPIAEAALYMVQICSALAEAHKLGIVHRDLKPANVLVTQGADGTPRVKLVDFGISKLLRDPEGMDPMTTLQGTVMGTPAFMSPEQINAGAVDTRTDIWAIGALLYHLVTGALPFAEADALMQSLTIVLTSPATPPTFYVPDLPQALEDLILRCLEKRPDDRPADVLEVSSILVPFSRGEIVVTPSPKPRTSPRPPATPRSAGRPPSPPRSSARPPTSPRSSARAPIPADLMSAMPTLASVESYTLPTPRPIPTPIVTSVPVVAVATLDPPPRRTLFFAVAVGLGVLVFLAALWLALGPAPQPVPALAAPAPAAPPPAPPTASASASLTADPVIQAPHPASFAAPRNYH